MSSASVWTSLNAVATPRSRTATLWSFEHAVMVRRPLQGRFLICSRDLQCREAAVEAESRTGEGLYKCVPCKQL